MKPWETHQTRNFKELLGGCAEGGVCSGLDSDRAGSRTLEKSSRRDRDGACAKFESSRRFRGSNMKPKKKSRRGRGLGLDSGLDLAISRFIYSFGLNVGGNIFFKCEFCETRWKKKWYFCKTDGQTSNKFPSPWKLCKLNPFILCTLYWTPQNQI